VGTFFAGLSWKFYVSMVAVVALIAAFFVWREDIRRAAYDSLMSDLVQQSNEDLKKQVEELKKRDEELEVAIKKMAEVDRKAEDIGREIEESVDGKQPGELSDYIRAALRAIYQSQQRERSSTAASADVSTESSPGSPSIQVGSHRRRADAERQLDEVLKIRTVSNMRGSVEEVQIPGRGRWYRAVIAGFGSQADAVVACESVRATGTECIVVGS